MNGVRPGTDNLDAVFAMGIILTGSHQKPPFRDMNQQKASRDVWRHGSWTNGRRGSDERGEDR